MVGPWDFASDTAFLGLAVVSLAIVGHWFVRRIDKAMAVYSVAISVGFMAAFPLVGYSVQRWGWRAAWLAIGITLLAVADRSKTLGIDVSGIIRTIEQVAGLFYIATFVFSIPALGLYDGVVNDAATRAAKAERYGVDVAGPAAYGGGRLNEVLYAPERWATTPGPTSPPDYRSRADP